MQMTKEQRLRRIHELSLELERILSLSPAAAAKRLSSRKARINQLIRARVYQQKMIDQLEKGSECIG